jgi:hypothetical protein
MNTFLKYNLDNSVEIANALSKLDIILLIWSEIISLIRNIAVNMKFTYVMKICFLS